MNRPDEFCDGPGGLPRQRGEGLGVPIVKEEFRVGKRDHTGVRVSTHAEEEHLNLSEPVGHEEVEVKRVPIGMEVD